MKEESEKVKRNLLKKKLRKKKESEEKRSRKTNQRGKRRYALVPNYVDTNGGKIVPVRTNIRNRVLKYFQN